MGKKSTLMAWSEYFALRCIAGGLQCFDVEHNLSMAANVGSLFFHMHRGRRERAEQNIALSFPHWDEEHVAEVAERSMQHMFQMFLVDALIMPRIVTPESWPRYVSIGNARRMVRPLLSQQPMILLTAHCGNWELLGYFLSLLNFRIHALARPLDNPLINDWLLGIREARGMKIITKWGATGKLQAILRKRGLVGFTGDQNAGDQGMFVPFFGRLASTYKSIGLLAMRYHVPILAGHARRKGGKFQFELICTDLIQPHEWADQPDPLFYITARYNRAMERMVTNAPEQYLWVHRRWKSRPRHERLGRPMPAKLREKIQALPWMTDSEFERIMENDARAVHAVRSRRSRSSQSSK